jgi:hypothetical protein
MNEWAKVALPGGAGTIDFVAVTARVMSERGVASERAGDELRLAEGLVLAPRVVGLDDAERGGFRSTTIVRVRHPEVFPTAVFEFQHAAGDTVEESLASGVEMWMQLDLPVLADATRDTPESCAVMKLTFPARDGRPARARRVLLGPTARFGAPDHEPATEGEHCFCPCCLTTHCFDAFKPLIDDDATYALRLYAARDPDGTPMADCRVNGEDYDPGKAALVSYATTWSGHGFEFRKQYVIMQRDRA